MEKTLFNILIIEDNDGDFLLVEEFLYEQFDELNLFHARNFKDALEFLNAGEGEKLAVDGMYKTEDVAAVKRFQQKYGDQILAPWGEKTPTGKVLKTTTAKINLMMCATQKGCPYFKKYEKKGDVNF